MYQICPPPIDCYQYITLFFFRSKFTLTSDMREVIKRGPTTITSLIKYILLAGALSSVQVTLVVHRAYAVTVTWKQAKRVNRNLTQRSVTERVSFARQAEKFLTTNETSLQNSLFLDFILVW